LKTENVRLEQHIGNIHVLQSTARNSRSIDLFFLKLTLLAISFRKKLFQHLIANRVLHKVEKNGNV